MNKDVRVISGGIEYTREGLCILTNDLTQYAQELRAERSCVYVGVANLFRCNQLNSGRLCTCGVFARG